MSNVFLIIRNENQNPKSRDDKNLVSGWVA